MYRQPIITIMGHIDSGKTTLLDTIKGTRIVDKEAGKITQHIGATEITLDQINKYCGHLAHKFKFDLKIPGLLFVDTPGHNAFDNLRERGGSLADLVVLVVDINKGLQAQDIETLEILKMYKVPFIVVANKIDLMNGWYQEGNDVTTVLNKQGKSVSDKLDEQLYKIVGQLFEKGFQAERFDRVEDFKKQIALIPASAFKNWGVSECILFLSALSQKFLDKRITLDENQKPQATILEIGELKGIGSTADVIVYQGVLKVKDKIVFPTKFGINETKIKSLLKLNVMSAVDKKKNNFTQVDYVSAASGVKVVAPGIEDCLPGGFFVSADDNEAVEHLKSRSFKCFSKSGSCGAFVKADTLGSLEALLQLLEKNNICVARADIGKVTSKDLLELKILSDKDKDQGVLFLFNTKIDESFEEELTKSKIPIFKNNIIYKLIEDYQDWLGKKHEEEKEKLLKEIIYPCKFKIMPNHIFRSSKPAVVGVKILCGNLVAGTRMMNDKFEVIGVVEAVQNAGKPIKKAEVDQEVAVSIKDATYLKDFKEKDVLESYLSIDNIKKLESLEGEFNDEELKLITAAKVRYYKSIE